MAHRLLATLAFAAVAALAAADAAAPIALDFSLLAQAFEGIGALSGGGGVTRLLIDYDEAIQQDIYDILFKPKAGASLQMIKVEIGGDTQSTEGTEASHMHTRGDLNCSRGYEWQVLREAKKRNPAIRTFGLSWGVPGWIGDGGGGSAGFGGSGYYSQDNLDYHLNFVYCSEVEWGIPLSAIGVWNERSPDPAWTKALRAALDSGGYENTRIVYGDVGWEVAAQVAADPALLEAVDVLGAHYPGQPPAVAYTLNRSLWASEMWNLGVVNDWEGATALANDLSQQARWGLSSSIVWCLIFSWFAPLPFSRPTGTNAGGGHALLTAAEPWSGNYIITPTVHVIAHHTQFAEPGWTYLGGAGGMGTLPGGGSYVTRVNTHVPSAELEFSITIDVMGVASAQTATFALTGLSAGRALPAALHVWSTTQAAAFAQQADVPVGPDGTFSVQLPADGMVSVTTTTGQSAPRPSAPVPPSSPFPFPYADSFEGYALQGYAKYFCDEGGLFIVDSIPASMLAGLDPAVAAGSAYHNVIDVIPIVWETNPKPYTLIGNFNGQTPEQKAWTDYTVSVSAALDPASTPPPPPGPELRAAQNACGAANAQWSLRSGSLATAAQLESVANPGLCLAVGGTDPNYASPEVVVSSCAGAKTWWGVRAATSQVVNNVTGHCIDVLAASKQPDDDLLNYACKAPNDPSGIINQQFFTQPGTGGATINLVSNNSGLCVVAAGPVAPSSTAAFLMVAARINVYERNGAPVSGYTLTVFASDTPTAAGTWRLDFAGRTPALANGTTASPIVPGEFHTLSVSCAGTRISASLDGIQLASVTDTAASSAFGMAAFGSSWTKSWFDNFKVSNNSVAEV